MQSLLTLIARAKETESFVWIDMESSEYREVTLRIYEEAVKEAGNTHTGICLQAYLRSTPQDLERLLPLSPSVRFVKGAYAEPPEIAYPDRKSVDEAFFELGARILTGGGRGAFGTHDSTLVDRLEAWVRAHEPDPTRYEFQMLYGIRSDLQRYLVAREQPIRVLISYGPAWFPWYMRRLAERPANVWFVVKNMVRLGGRRAQG
jgi:proline dehydrogenase